ncbi:MAG: hypothetical protein DMF74_19030 [Acidobacteria bacterium]|nr:MAG: hypothetical protein DMF74_19030 [Acidobacteriota bacterium]
MGTVFTFMSEIGQVFITAVGIISPRPSCPGSSAVSKSQRVPAHRQIDYQFDSPAAGAPTGHPLADAKPDSKARPAGRKAKHEQKPKRLELDDEYCSFALRSLRFTISHLPFTSVHP